MATPITMSKPLAVFDVDGTQFKSACVEKFIDEAIRQDVFSADMFAETRAKRRLWQSNNNEGIYQSYLHNLVGAFVASMAGLEVARFNVVTATMIDEHRVRMYSFTRNLLRLVSPSHETIAISGSPLPVVGPFLQNLGFDKILGSTFEVADGHFTGKAQSVNKADALSHIATDSTVNIGIGDTVGDVPVLRKANVAIAFNPSATLRREAIKNNWFIVTEQKDAVTQLLPSPQGYQVVFDNSPQIILDVAGVSL